MHHISAWDQRQHTTCQAHHSQGAEVQALCHEFDKVQSLSRVQYHALSILMLMKSMTCRVYSTAGLCDIMDGMSPAVGANSKQFLRSQLTTRHSGQQARHSAVLATSNDQSRSEQPGNVQNHEVHIIHSMTHATLQTHHTHMHDANTAGVSLMLQQQQGHMLRPPMCVKSKAD